jgi:hypothetical protein
MDEASAPDNNKGVIAITNKVLTRIGQVANLTPSKYLIKCAGRKNPFLDASTMHSVRTRNVLVGARRSVGLALRRDLGKV